MKRTVYLNVLFLLVLSLGLKAQQIVDVLPLTDRILVVHFDEGFVTHHKRGQQRSQEFTTRTLLNVSSASNTASYQLSSTDDASYTTAKNPTSIGRKSKGTEWALLCESFDPTIGCVNTSPDHADEHWLYLYLPTALQRGKTYTLNTGTLGSNGSTWPFTYDEKTIRSEAVHVNQIGYKPNAALKFGYVYHWAGDKGSLDLSAYVGKAFWVVNTTTNTVAFSGTLQLGKSKLNPETGQVSDTPNANFSGADVYECNFSALTTPGDYVLAVEGIGRSFPFSISQTIYNEPFVSVMNGLFKNRSGIAIAKGDISDQTRPAPHNPNLTPGFASRLYYSTARDRDYVTDGGGAADKAGFEAGKKGLINTWGWYQDAGDWDGYPTHARIPINLMFLYENFPTKFTDNALKLAERNNGTPDVLDEARWLLRFYHRTRHAIQDAGYGTGGVGGARVFGDYWGDDTRADGTTKASWEDTDRDWYVSGEDVWTTYKYAGMAAHFAYCLSLANVNDPESINWQQEAIDAYTWAKAHQVADDETAKNGYNLAYERLYSAAMLYRLTGTASYHDDFKTQFNALSLDGNLQDDIRFGLWAYTLMPSSRPTDATIIATIRAKAQSAADNLIVGPATKRAARWGGDFYFPMLVGQASSPMTNEGFTAYSILKNTNPDKANEYLKYSTTTADYFLGNNPLNQTWVTGLGERYPKEIFHLDSWYSDEGTTRTGIVPYGPWRTTTPRPVTGWFDLHFPEKSLYPAGMDNWPGHERWYDQRTAPIPAEFTVHQNLLLSFMTFGFLLGAEEPAFQTVAITGVTLAPNTLTLFVNQTGTLTATVQPASATNPAITWTSSNTAVASVLGGAVTGVATGTATITAQTADGGFSASAVVTIIPAPVVSCANNLIVNPGFEDANLSAYFLLNSSVVGNDTHSGNKALLISDGGYVNQQYYNAPQGTYTFRVWTKRASSAGYALVQFKFVDADGNDIGTPIEQNFTASDTYQETVIGPVQAPANTSKVLVGFPAGGGTSLLIDDLCLTNIPVETPNTAPTVANPIGEQTATVGQAFSFTIPANTFTDAETPNSLTVTVAGLPANLTFGNGKVSGTPSTTGVSSVTVTATDSGSLSVSTIFGLNVLPALPDQSGCIGNFIPNPGFEFPLPLNDPEQNGGFYNVSVVNDAHSGTKALQIGNGTSGGHLGYGAFHEQPLNMAPQPGQYNLRVWLKKTGNPSYTSVKVSFYTAQGNGAGNTVELVPSLTDTYQEITLDPGTALSNVGQVLVDIYTGDGGSVQADDLCLTFTPASQPQSVSIAASSTTLSCATPVVSLTASGNADSYVWNTGATTATISVTAASTYSVTATTGATSSTAAITIGQDNSGPAQPVLSSTSNGKICSNRGGNVLTISPTAACSVGTIQYIVTSTGSHTGTVSGSNLVLSAVGSYTVSATCGQAGGCVSAASVPVSATIYADPVVLAPVTVTPNPATPGQVVTLSASVSSVAPITYVQLQLYDGPNSVAGIPSSSTASPYSATFTIPLSLTATGLSPNVYVADANGCSVTRYEGILTINPASPVNTAPTVANVIAPQSATVGQGFSFVIPASTFTDAETPSSLSLSVSGLPPGLAFSNGTISGTPSTSGTSSITVTATDPGSLSVSTSFGLVVSPASSLTGTAPFALTGVTTVSCLTVNANLRTLSFTPQYAGLTGQPVSFWVVNELVPTIAPGPYSLNLYTDNPVITLKATQAGTAGETSFVYNWLAACSGNPPTNTAPTVANVIAPQSATVGQGFSFVIPASTFTDAETPSSLSLSVSGLPPGLAFSNGTISGTPSTSGTSSITVTATDPGSLSVSTSFGLVVSPASSLTGTAPFALTGVTMVSCLTVNANLRTLSFTPQYAGLTGQPVSFWVVNEKVPTTAPGPYSLNLYTDNPVITLKATQAGTVGETSFVYNWLAACANAGNTAPANGRVAAEREITFAVSVYPNPVGDETTVLIEGAARQTVLVQLTTINGQVVASKRVDVSTNQHKETVRLGGQPTGLYLLQVSSEREKATLKLIKQ